MDVTLQYFGSCPGWQSAAKNLQEALEATGRTDVVVRHELIETDAAARAAHFVGSPTVLINRRDPFAVSGEPHGLACRLYRTEDGLTNTPSTAQLITALTNAQTPASDQSRPDRQGE